jgi:hypothetical protein
LDRRVDREEKAAIAQAQKETRQARGKPLEEKIAKAVQAGQADAGKHQNTHPDRWRDFVWDGSTPDEFVRVARAEVGLGKATYMWGGMGWDFHVHSGTEYVKVEYGDRVFIRDGVIHVEKGR